MYERKPAPESAVDMINKLFRTHFLLGNESRLPLNEREQDDRRDDEEEEDDDKNDD